MARCVRLTEEIIITSGSDSHFVPIISQIFKSGYELCQDLSSKNPSLNISPINAALEKLSSFSIISIRTTSSKEVPRSNLGASVLDNKFPKGLGILDAVKSMSLGAFNPEMSLKDKKSNLGSERKIVPHLAVEDKKTSQHHSKLGSKEQTNFGPDARYYWDTKTETKTKTKTPTSLTDEEFSELVIQNVIDNANAYHSNIVDGPRYGPSSWFSTGSDSSDGSLDENIIPGKLMSQVQDDDSSMDDDRTSDETSGEAAVKKDTVTEEKKSSNQYTYTKCVEGHCTVNGELKPVAKEPADAVKEKVPKRKEKKRWLWFVFVFIRGFFNLLLLAIKYVLAGGAMLLGICEMLCLVIYGFVHHVLVVPIYGWTNESVPWLMSPASMEAFILPAYSKEKKAYEYQSKEEEKDDERGWFEKLFLYEDE